ncbi:MAG: ketoacyl-ACP synthase III [Anaerolineae bacterium]|nr:ketoacyl-ACP synthase III [Anaerolineae bacterium]
MAANFPAAPRYAHIVGWGMAVPERVLTNHDLAAIVETSDTWIRERTGISERRIAGENESTATLGFAAARRALEKAAILPTELGLIIVATSTPEHIFPSTASLIQDWLGASGAGAFDLSAACTGFIYALDMATQAIRSGSINAALVIGAETMSRLLDWQDRGTCILFGDGAGAVVVAASDAPGGILSNVVHSDGSGCDLLGVPTVGSRDAVLPDAGLRADTRPPMHKLYMNGREVFRFATRAMKDVVLEALERADVPLDEVDWIVPHQANERIIASAARNLKLPIEKFVVNVSAYGNTSAASIPIALCEAVDAGRIVADQTIVLVGFGGGLTWGATTLTWGVTPPQELSRMDRYRREVIYRLSRQRSRLSRTLRRVGNTLNRSPLRGVYRAVDRVGDDTNGKRRDKRSAQDDEE